MIKPYIRLMRLDKNTGTWLLLLPCWWSICLVRLDIKLMVLFAIGAVFMRGAGCLINDIFDHKIDAQVERTKNRPLANGDLTLRQAIVFLVFLLLCSLAVLLQLPQPAIILGIASLPLVAIYPLMKRITWWPQAFLGLTFNWGALVGGAAANEKNTSASLWLYAAGFFWTLGYDTIYAHQDKRGDANIGVRSTALLLGERSKAWIYAWYTLTILGLAAAGLAADLSYPFYIMLLPAAAFLGLQVRKWHPDDPDDCLKRFKSNVTFGIMVLLAVMVGKLA